MGTGAVEASPLGSTSHANAVGTAAVSQGSVRGWGEARSYTRRGGDRVRRRVVLHDSRGEIPARRALRHLRGVHRAGWGGFERWQWQSSLRRSHRRVDAVWVTRLQSPVQGWAFRQ